MSEQTPVSTLSTPTTATTDNTIPTATSSSKKALTLSDILGGYSLPKHTKIGPICKNPKCNNKQPEYFIGGVGPDERQLCTISCNKCGFVSVKVI